MRSPDELPHELQVYQIELEARNEALRQAQAAMVESHERFMEIYDFAPVGYLTLTEAGVIAEINLTGAALLGGQRGALIQRRFEHFVAPGDIERWKVFFSYVLRHGGKQNCELCLERRDGTIFDASLDCLLNMSSGSGPVLRVTLADISARKQALNRLSLSEDRLRLAKNASGLGIYDRDITTGNLEWDERTREIWGVGPDEPVTYATFMSGVHPDDRAAVQAAVDRALDPHGTGGYDVEYRVLNRFDGSVRQVAANGQVFFAGGRAIRFVGTVKDISARKRLEAEVQERRNAMELLIKQQVAAQTAAAIAHELNQPLVSISAYSEAALSMLRGGTKNPDKLAHALESAAEQAQRAGRTLHELLDFLHQGEVTSEPVELNLVVREALAIAAESGYGGFQAVIELESGLPPVQANRLHLQKVLVNLLHNGVDAMRGAGVPLAAITITVRTMAGSDAARVTIQDSGPGLDRKTVHRVFEPFYSTKPKGIGLGLAISRALIEAHGGQLWADIEHGPGATFHFTVPFAS